MIFIPIDIIVILVSCFLLQGSKYVPYIIKAFFQQSLMHFPFLYLDEIIHPNAEKIPDHIHHFVSAMYCNNSFWCNFMKILPEMEMEGHRNNYIQTYISYLNSLRANYNLYYKSLLFLLQYSLFELVSNHLTIWLIWATHLSIKK